MSRFRRRISSAHLIALVALFVSLGGTWEGDILDGAR